MHQQTQDAQCCNSASIADGMKRSISQSPPQLMCETTALLSVDLLHHKESQSASLLGFPLMKAKRRCCLLSLSCLFSSIKRGLAVDSANLSGDVTVTSLQTCKIHGFYVIAT